MFTGVNDTADNDRGLSFLQNYLLPPKSATATEVGHGRGVVGHGHRSRPRPPILSLEQPRKGAKAPHTPWDPWGRQNYCKPKRHYLVLAASGVSDQDVWGVYGCSFSWWFQWHHRRPWPTSAAGDIVDLSPSTFSYLWQLPTSMASLFLSPPIIGHRCQR